jgi:hypothetical protein
MRICGWQTTSVFKRYAIVDQADVRLALQQLERARQKQPDHPVERISGLEYTPRSESPTAVC